MAGLTDEQENEVREAFALADKNGTGTIQTKEVGMVVRALGMNPSDEELQEMIQGRGDGVKITYNDFVDMVGDRMNEVENSRDVHEVENIDPENYLYDKNMIGNGLIDSGISVDIQQLQENETTVDDASRNENIMYEGESNIDEDTDDENTVETRTDEYCSDYGQNPHEPESHDPGGATEVNQLDHVVDPSFEVDILDDCTGFEGGALDDDKSFYESSEFDIGPLGIELDDGASYAFANEIYEDLDAYNVDCYGYSDGSYYEQEEDWL